MEDFKIDFQTAVILGTYLISVAGLYWKIRMDVASLQIQVDDIKEKRKTKWREHDENHKKQDKKFDDIIAGINEVKGDVREIKESIKWLKKGG